MADAQNIAKMAAGKAVNPLAKVKMAKNFLQHWHILGVAAIFDLIGMIPLVCVVTNFVFMFILYMHFGAKSKGSQFLQIAVPGAITTIADSLMGILPACLACTVIRILMEE